MGQIAPGTVVTSTGYTIENNLFTNSGAVPMSAHIKTRSNAICNDLLIRYNTILDDGVISECPGTNVRWHSNVLDYHSGCGTVGSFDYTVIIRREPTTAGCGDNDIVVDDPALVNGRLLSASPAVGAGNPLDVAGTDFEGQNRPFGSAPDAGSDEYVEQDTAITAGPTGTVLSPVATFEFTSIVTGPFEPPRRRRLGYVHIAEELHGTHPRQPHLRCQSVGRGRQRRPDPCLQKLGRAGSGAGLHGRAHDPQESSYSLTIDRPAAPAPGDTLIAWVATDSTHAISSPPTGWTQIGTTQHNGSDSSVSVFSHTVGALDPSSWTGTFVNRAKASIPSHRRTRRRPSRRRTTVR
jgi:hypothetical protein